MALGGDKQWGLKRKHKQHGAPQPKAAAALKATPPNSKAPSRDDATPPTPPSTMGGYCSQEVLIFGMANPAFLPRLREVLAAHGPLVHLVRTRKLVRAVFAAATVAAQVAAPGNVSVDGRSYTVKLHQPPDEGPPSERVCLFGIPPDVPGKMLADIFTQQLGEAKAKSWSRLLIADTGLAIIHFDAVESAALARSRLHGLGLATPGSGAALRLWARYQSEARGRWMHQSGEVVEYSNPALVRRRRQKEESRPVQESAISAIPLVASQGMQERIATLREELANAKAVLQDLEQQVQAQKAQQAAVQTGGDAAATLPRPKKRAKTGGPVEAVAVG